MSRIGKQPVAVPAEVKVEVNQRAIRLSGTKGTLNWEVPVGIVLEHDQAAHQIIVRRQDDLKQSRANHGLSRALINNMVQGVSQGFQKELHIYGTGFSCKLEGKNLQLNVGFSGLGHGRAYQFAVPVPDGLDIEILVPNARGESDPAKFVVRGADKQQVGQFAAEVRKLRKPEPYQGKGIRYKDEVVRRKAGKAFASGSA